MRKMLLAALAGSVVACALWAAPAVGAQEVEYEMTTYQLVLLRAGPDARPLGERATQDLQERHLALLERLYEDGSLLIEGPIGGGGELRGMLVLDVGSVEAARRLMAEDPWVHAGQRVAEVHPWYTAKDLMRKPTSYAHGQPCTLGLLDRPPNAPDYAPEKLEEIQAGHLANIRRMVDSGDLVLAGPLTDDGVLRGIFVFRTLDHERIVEQFRQDPAHAAGRLALRLYPWRVPLGSLPGAPAR